MGWHRTPLENRHAQPLRVGEVGGCTPARAAGSRRRRTPGVVYALGSKVKELEAIGWHVNLSESSVSVQRYFKNGKPRKGGDAGILKNDEEGSNRLVCIWAGLDYSEDIFAFGEGG